MINTVTKELIDSKIKDVKYTVLEDHKTTICNIYMKNGYNVNGFSACVDPDNFDLELGKKYSYENAYEKIWALEGYLLAEKCYLEKNQE